MRNLISGLALGLLLVVASGAQAARIEVVRSTHPSAPPNAFNVFILFDESVNLGNADVPLTVVGGTVDAIFAEGPAWVVPSFFIGGILGSLNSIFGSGELANFSGSNLVGERVFSPGDRGSLGGFVVSGPAGAPIVLAADSDLYQITPGFGSPVSEQIQDPSQIGQTLATLPEPGLGTLLWFGLLALVVKMYPRAKA